MKLHNNGGHKTYQIWINARTIPKGNQNMFQLHDINILKHKMYNLKNNFFWLNDANKHYYYSLLYIFLFQTQ